MREKELKKLKKAMATGIMMVLTLVIMLVIYTVDSGFGDYEIVDVMSADSVYSLDEDASSRTVYKFDNVLIIDEYATYSESYGIKDDMAYYLVAFVDKYDEVYLASLEVDTGLDIFDKIEAYINDDSQYIGDFSIPICAATDAKSDSDLSSYYREAVEKYTEILNDEELEVSNSYLKLKYACDVPANIDKYAAAQTRQSLIVYAMMGGFALVMLAMTIRAYSKIKKLKRMNEEEFISTLKTQDGADVQMNMNTDTQTGEYYDPSQSQYFNPYDNNSNE